MPPPPPPDTVLAMGYTPRYGPAGDRPNSVKFNGTRFVASQSIERNGPFDPKKYANSGRGSIYLQIHSITKKRENAARFIKISNRKESSFGRQEKSPKLLT